MTASSPRLKETWGIEGGPAGLTEASAAAASDIRSRNGTMGSGSLTGFSPARQRVADHERMMAEGSMLGKAPTAVSPSGLRTDKRSPHAPNKGAKGSTSLPHCGPASSS